MKKIRQTFIGLLALLTISACKKDTDLGPGFDLRYNQQFEIPAGIGGFVTHHFYLQNIPSRYVQTLDQQGKTDADVTAILTTSAALTGLFGDANFDFIEQVSVRVFHEDDPSNYIEVAYRYPVPLEPGNSLPLIPSLADSKRFVSADRFSVEVVLWLRNTTVDNTPVVLDLQFKATY